MKELVEIVRKFIQPKVTCYRPKGLTVMRNTLKRWLTRNRDIQDAVSASSGYEVVENEPRSELTKGWLDPVVAERQHKAFVPLLRQMYRGKPREDFVAVAKAVELTGLKYPLILEVGCGSGWNSEVLAHLLKSPVRYIGLDYSGAMTRLGKACYQDVQFIVGDAARLPFQDDACEILLSGTVLMHLLSYHDAIRESRRVARKWCIFHTVPIVYERPTTILTKLAYGIPVVEIVFNEEEFSKLITDSGLLLHEVFDSVPHDYLSDVLNAPVSARTCLCAMP